MAKFDLMGMLSERSIQETEIPEQKIVYRSPEDLIPDKENFYSTESLKKLKESIKLLGLLQPLLIESRDGKDYIVAGHCRQKCCLELLKEGEERFQKIPCIYTIKDSQDPEENEIIKKIRLIQANTYREKSDWEKMTETLQMEELVKELRKKSRIRGKEQRNHSRSNRSIINPDRTLQKHQFQTFRRSHGRIQGEPDQPHNGSRTCQPETRISAAGLRDLPEGRNDLGQRCQSTESPPGTRKHSGANDN